MLPGHFRARSAAALRWHWRAISVLGRGGHQQMPEARAPAQAEDRPVEAIVQWVASVEPGRAEPLVQGDVEGLEAV